MTLSEVKKQTKLLDIEYTVCKGFVPIIYHLLLTCDFRSTNIIVDFGYVTHKLTNQQAQAITATQVWIQLYASEEEKEGQDKYWNAMFEEMQIKVSPLTLD